ncbi:MAG: PH domain-containing protein [Burkholderiales bacterium]|jgi:uncharacterized membrane protein YdbT with pleckstrin-like domain|nr:PH domain-containing protein [Burkholderiales bacterium]
MAGRIRHELVLGEDLIYQGKASIWAFAISVVKNSIWIVLVYFAYQWIKSYIDHPMIYTVFQVIAALYFLMIVNDFMILITTELYVTNKRIIAKFGFIKRRTLEIALNRIESIQTEQVLFGRLFNYGTMIFSGGGDYQLPISWIAQPMDVRNAIMDAREEN